MHGKVAELFPMAVAFGKKMQITRSQPRVHGSECSFKRRWSFENTETGHHADEFMNARPRNRPGSGVVAEGIKQRLCVCMMRAFPAVRIDQQVRIKRNHVPRPR